MERVVAALQHQEPDRVPVYPILCGITRKLTGVSYPEWSQDADKCAEAFIKSTEEFDIDCIVTLIDLSVECAAWGQKLIFDENEAAHPDYSQCVIQDIEDYPKIKKVDYRTCDRMMMHIDVCKKLVAAKGGEKPIVAFVFGPLGVLSMLRNQEDLYMDIYDDPDAVKEAVKEINETLKEYCIALAETGINAIMFDTLFASGSIMSKEMWDDMEGEAIEELSNVVREYNCMVMIHNCGEKIYFDAQIKRMDPVAISFLYPPDDCASFAECKEKYGDKVRVVRFGPSCEFCGGIHAHSTGRIGMFKIISESSVAAGVRRIEAKTGKECEMLMYDLEDGMKAIKALFNNTKDLLGVIEKYIEEHDSMKKSIEQFQAERVERVKEKLISQARIVNGVKVIASTLIMKQDAAKDLVFKIRAAEPERMLCVVGSTFDGRPTLSVMISEDLVKEHGLNAGQMVREAAKLIKGGGGGQPHFATAGGKDIDGLSAAVDKVIELANL